MKTTTIKTPLYSWKPQYAEWSKIEKWFAVDEFPLASYYIHCRCMLVPQLSFKVRKDKDCERERERQWIRTCRIALRCCMDANWDDKEIIDLYASAMGLEKVREYIRLWRIKHGKSSKTVFYG